LEDHPRYRKAGSPQFISHEGKGHLEKVPKPQVLGTKRITIVINHVSKSWDDPPSTPGNEETCHHTSHEKFGKIIIDFNTYRLGGRKMFFVPRKECSKIPTNSIIERCWKISIVKRKKNKGSLFERR